MILILLRHGERDASYDGIRPEAIGKARDLGTQLKNSPWCTQGLILFHSPKVRCRQTAEALGASLGVSPLVVDALDEARSQETVSAFSGRVSDLLIELGAAPPAEAVILVSHSDWLEVAGDHLLQGRPLLSWAPGKGHVIEIVGKTRNHLARC